MLKDLRYALRALRARPGLVTAAVLTLAIGIGANTAVFSLVNALLLEPVPGIRHSDGLVNLGRTQGGEGFDSFSYPDLVDYREGGADLMDIAVHRVTPMHLGTGGGSDRVTAALVSGNYFSALQLTPAAGRLFQVSDDLVPGGHPVLVLAEAYWRERFGGDPEIVGQTVSVNGYPFAVVGVAPRSFAGVQLGVAVDAWAPLAMTDVLMPGRGDLLDSRVSVWLDAFGRLRDGAPFQSAAARLDAIATELNRQYPEATEGRGITLAAGLGLDPDTRGSVMDIARVLLVVVGLVLLIACANVANLLLARGATRKREMAVRASLGATRARLARQLAAECVVLGLAGGGVGIWLSFWLDAPLGRLPVLSFLTPNLALGPDPRVLGFTVLATLLAMFVFGLPPALMAARADVARAMREGDDRAPAGARLRNGLVVAQLALSLVLLVGAGLLVRTVQRAYAIPTGFDAERVLVASVDLARQGYDGPRGRTLYRELVEGAQALPGVEAASLAMMAPLQFAGWDTRVVAADAAVEPEDGARTDRNAVTPGYFRTMGIRTIAGRDFSASDVDGAPPVAIVNQATVDQLWPGQDAIGRRLRLWSNEEPLEVVGVVDDAKYRTVLEDRRLMIYQPFAQAYAAAMTLHVRTSGNARAVAPAVSDLVRRLDAGLPVYRVATLDAHQDEVLGAERSLATLVGLFALMAVLLAAVGLYGSLSYAVSRRTRELGIRMAVGAAARDVRMLVLRQGLWLAAAGTALGLAGALAVTRLIRGFLFGVSPTDPATLVAVAVLLLGVAAAASYVPAARATRVDPMEALRTE